MFSTNQRCIYRRNPLGNVICQLRFPQILSIGTEVPDKFQEAIRDQFPLYTKKKEVPMLPGMPPAPVQGKEPVINHQFTSADGVWRVNLTSGFISLSTPRYTCWEEFAGKLDKPLAAFIKIYNPAFFQRIGLRYVNFISRKTLSLEDMSFRELIEPCYLDPLAEEDVAERSCSRCSVDVEMAIRGGCRVKIHAGPGHVNLAGKQDPEVKYILDLDLFMPGQVPVNTAAGSLHTLHAQSYPIFRGAITQELHNALEPQ